MATVARRLRPARATGLALAAALTAAAAAPALAPSPAEAQTLKDLLDQRRESRGESPAPESDDAPQGLAGAESDQGAAEPPKPRLTPEQQLELAFENLRSDEETVWKAAQDKIARAWSRSGSASMDLLLNRGRAAIKREDWEAAVDHLTDLVNLAPDFAEGWNTRASVYYRQEKLGPALADLAEAVARDPRHFSAFAGLGVIFEKLEDPERAIAAYRAALKIHPNLETALEAVRRLTAKADGRPA